MILKKFGKLELKFANLYPPERISSATGVCVCVFETQTCQFQLNMLAFILSHIYMMNTRLVIDGAVFIYF